ncbi:uncharacterized protein LOC115998875 [Ipomoea triloba]|uniref:uncharacterized protein LOC115998875 n=1 Tax=Ipomoea triloba TaxID=35885 RepID=UPI00125E4233|nr:uncharacterized protein LOC115998875 [Ipomoea triloba]XP_031094398.1 uncharacterized protein LOC115998875 [Ipomoea triloba]XP_031094399.1 uncharacterized protein LOC115998875 [Ipomoea triloba]XP_031094400.1 uncharacterized protein LOC115998875 [Ipomoea triloba]XP_031094401.1 uncharacterized protein LOC115998875 [Ipomoea triloba]XP_031094402.1 uncharacterized protein LOC115998875 [Ipomoea triloba]XP_031094403.1 uncharacterized protein LOC115998875 [Ipomoea triloba]XP_031094404.1 uncharacte
MIKVEKQDDDVCGTKAPSSDFVGTLGELCTLQVWRRKAINSKDNKAGEQDHKNKDQVNVQSQSLRKDVRTDGKSKEKDVTNNSQGIKHSPTGVCENDYKKNGTATAGNVNANKNNVQGHGTGGRKEIRGVKQGQTTVPRYASLFAKDTAKAGVSVLAGLAQPEIRDKVTEVHRGLPAIRFEEAEIKQLNIIEDHLLIGKFSWGRPNLDNIRRHFAEKFILKGSITIGWIDPRHITLAFSNEEDCLEILMKDQILFEGKYPMRIFRWTLGFSTEKESSLAAVWIQLPMLSANLFNLAALKQICRPIGKFLAADHATLNFSGKNEMNNRTGGQVPNSKGMGEKAQQLESKQAGTMPEKGKGVAKGNMPESSRQAEERGKQEGIKIREGGVQIGISPF